MRFFIDISYDGTNYHGWQVQPNADTVQNQINNALSKILNKQINVVGAGRTDTGVHAKQLIAHFDFEEKFDFQKIQFKLNGFLNNDISINNIYLVKDDAHARFSALSRTYQYKISKSKDPFSNQSFLLKRNVDLESMNKACEFLIGKNDYSAFAKLHSDNYTNNCNIFYAKWEESQNNIVFTIKANRFLRNMVRSIVGTMIEIGDGKMKFDKIKDVILSKDRSNAGYSVPAIGLCLVSIEYPKEILDGEF